MKVWIKTGENYYDCTGKFPWEKIQELKIARFIEEAQVNLNDFKYGYKVLQPFQLDVAGLVLQLNTNCLITGD